MVLQGLRGVVERDGDGYVGRCDEVGTISWGRTIEEAFDNLRAATWRALEQQAARKARWCSQGAPGNVSMETNDSCTAA